MPPSPLKISWPKTVGLTMLGAAVVRGAAPWIGWAFALWAALILVSHGLLLAAWAEEPRPRRSGPGPDGDAGGEVRV